METRAGHVSSGGMYTWLMAASDDTGVLVLVVYVVITMPAAKVKHTSIQLESLDPSPT